MSREDLEKRNRWQLEAEAREKAAKDLFSTIMKMHLQNSKIEIIHRPWDLREIYSSLPLDQGPLILLEPHGLPGVSPEFCLHNTESDKRIYVEIESQLNTDNAHGRICEYFTPGTVKSIQDIANQPADVHPVWVLFTKGLETGEQQKIRHWFRGIERNLLLWKDFPDYEIVVSHFEQHIRPLLN